MALACANNIPTSYSTYGWFNPRISLTQEYNEVEEEEEEEDNKIYKCTSSSSSSCDPQLKDAADFEFRLGNNVTMLPADELFSDGKLVPLQFSTAAKPSAPPPPSSSEAEEATEQPYRRTISEDLCLFSPKAPKCSSRWRKFLGLKKVQTTSSTSTSIRQFLNRGNKTTSSDPSLNLPLLKDTPSSSSSSSRVSLSSSSSSHDHEEPPRQSLDAEKPTTKPNRSTSSGPKLRTVRPKMENPRVGRSPMKKTVVSRGVSVDSPRMNPSGKVVFQSLERSSSSPSSFNNGGTKYKNKGGGGGVMERSYSGNIHVRITPVLNVPVCSLRGSSKSGVFGFGQLFSSSSSSSSSHKKEGGNTNASHCNTRSCHNTNNQHLNNSRNKKDKEKKEKEMVKEF